MRLGDLDALSAFVGDLRSTLHKEQSTFKAMTQSEFEIKDNMLLNFQYAIDNAPTVEPEKAKEGELVKAYTKGFDAGVETARPQGEWIKHIDDLFPTESTQECSLCHEIQLINGNDDNFCPNCGADMRGDNDDG